MTAAELATRLGAKRTGVSWVCRCPAHDDRRASLAIREGTAGRTLVHCYAGCTFDAIFAALGIDRRELFPDVPTNGERRSTGAEIVTTYPYRDEHGEVLFEVVRREGKKFHQRRPDGAGGWINGLGDTCRVPYRLPELLAADPEDLVSVVEGEKDADKLAALDLVATCNPGGAGKWRPEYSAHFRGRDVVILADNDEPGRKHAEHVAQELSKVAVRVRVVELPGLPDKGDVSDWLAAGHTKDELLAIVGQTPAWERPPMPATEPAPPAATPAVEIYDGDLLAFLGHDEPDEDPSRDYIVHGIIPRVGPFIFGGYPKQGKTLAVEDLAIAITSGAADWCGFPISDDMRGARVLLMPREDPETETRVRIWRLCRGRGLDPRDLAGRLVVVTRAMLYLDDPGCVAKLRRTMEGVDLALIDSLQTVHRGDENSARDMGVVCGAWRDTSLETSKSIGLVHHYNGKGQEGDRRDPGHRLRGSSVLFATPRLVVGVDRLTRPTNAIAIRVSGNLGHLPEPFAVRLVMETLPNGRRAYRYEHVGKLGELRNPDIADAIIAALRQAKDHKLSSRDLRDAVRERIDEVSNAAIDAEARLLSRDKRIERHTRRSPWRLVEEES
jgi:hypothetical protein